MEKIGLRQLIKDWVALDGEMGELRKQMKLYRGLGLSLSVIVCS